MCPSLLVQPVLPVQGLQRWSELLEQHWVSASCSLSGFGDCSRQENLDGSFSLHPIILFFSLIHEVMFAAASVWNVALFLRDREKHVNISDM